MQNMAKQVKGCKLDAVKRETACVCACVRWMNVWDCTPWKRRTVRRQMSDVKAKATLFEPTDLHFLFRWPTLLFKHRKRSYVVTRIRSSPIRPPSLMLFHSGGLFVAATDETCAAKHRCFEDATQSHNGQHTHTQKVTALDCPGGSFGWLWVNRQMGRIWRGDGKVVPFASVGPVACFALLVKTTNGGREGHAERLVITHISKRYKLDFVAIWRNKKECRTKEMQNWLRNDDQRRSKKEKKEKKKEKEEGWSGKSEEWRRLEVLERRTTSCSARKKWLLLWKWCRRWRDSEKASVRVMRRRCTNDATSEKQVKKVRIRVKRRKKNNKANRHKEDEWHERWVQSVTLLHSVRRNRPTQQNDPTWIYIAEKCPFAPVPLPVRVRVCVRRCFNWKKMIFRVPKCQSFTQN